MRKKKEKSKDLMTAFDDSDGAANAIYSTGSIGKKTQPDDDGRHPESIENLYQIRKKSPLLQPVLRNPAGRKQQRDNSLMRNGMEI